MRTTVIYHRADYDGLFSAAVCSMFLPDAEMIGWDFGDPFIPQPEGRTYIVDLSPDCLEGVYVDRELIWIDHHKSSISKWDDQLGNPFPGYRIDGVAACRLCWQWFQKHPSGGFGSDDPMLQCAKLPALEDYKERRVDEPMALTLAGEYDVWDKQDPRAEAFQFGLTAHGLDDWAALMMTFLADLRASRHQVEDVCATGESVMNWQRIYAAQVCRDRSYVREWEGQTFCILGSPHARSSMWFPQEAIPEECDALMCWRYDGERVMFSLYHAPGHEEHDLSQIAVKYGGGGHRGACGFTLSLDEALKVIR